MRFRGAAAALATFALVAVSGANGAGSLENGPIVFAAGPAEYTTQFVAADLRKRRTTFTEIPEGVENPAVSPGGRFVAFGDWVGEYPANTPRVFVQGMKGGSRHSVGEGCDPSWSPSGRQIAFVHVNSPDFCNQAEIAVVNRDGSKLRGLAYGFVSMPRWSPNGNWLAFVRRDQSGQRSDLYVVRPQGNDEHVVADGISGVGGAGDWFSWAPDSTRIAVFSGGGLQVASVTGGRLTPLVDDPSVYAPRWSPNGRWVAFADGQYHIAVVDVRDRAKAVVGQGLEAAWTGNDRLAFSATEGIRSARYDGSDSHLVIRAPTTVWYRDLQPLSARGLAFRRETIDYDARLYALDPELGSVRPLTAASVRGVEPAVSPDGRLVAFTRVRPEGNHVIAVVGTTGRRVRTLTHNRYGWDYQPAWSPNGRRIAFVRGSSFTSGALYAVGARGGKPHLLWSGERPGHPAWAPDGRRIAIDGVLGGNSQSPGIRLVIPGEEGFVEITHGAGTDLAPSWSPNGTMLSFVRRYSGHGASDQVFVLDLATGEQQPITRLTDENTFLHPSAAHWSPDGTRLVVPTCVVPGFLTCVRAGVATMAPDGTLANTEWERPTLSALDVAWGPSPRR